MKPLSESQKRALVAEGEIVRLRSALKAVADDPDTNAEAAVYARNALLEPPAHG